MARRRLLSPEQWAGFLAAPTDERDILRHYTLSRDDLDLIAGKRTAHRRLGFALVLCYLRHPGRVLEQHEDPPTDRKSVVSGKSVSVRVDLGGRRNIKKKNNNYNDP